MEDIKEIERYIEKKWFKNHVATVSETDCATILDWSAPGTNKYSVRYIFAGRNLYVSGDIGDAIFNLTWRATIESFDDIELGYLLGKLSCHSRERWHFDEELAIKELNEWYEDATYGTRDNKNAYVQELDRITANVSRFIVEVSDHKEFERRLIAYYRDNTFDYIDSEDFAMFYDFGKKLPNDKELAIKKLNEWYEDAKNEKDDYLQELDRTTANVSKIIQQVSSHKEFELHLFNYYMDNTFDYIDSEAFAMFSDFGKKLPNEFVAYLLGIKLAMSQLLEAKKERV
jgi:hypothetical protein